MVNVGKYIVNVKGWWIDTRRNGTIWAPKLEGPGFEKPLMLTAPFCSRGFGLWVKRVPSNRVWLEH